MVGWGDEQDAGAGMGARSLLVHGVGIIGRSEGLRFRSGTGASRSRFQHVRIEYEIQERRS